MLDALNATSALRMFRHGGRWLVLLSFLLAGLGLPAVADGQDEEISRLLRQIGIRPVEPPSSALDFRLPLVEGGSQDLAAYHGEWVVLTFFATWCAPCIRELPTLNDLQRRLAGNGGGVAVIGVSIDRSRESLPPFLDDLDVDFTVLWDEGGTAARMYRAASIPLSYIIDPAGRIVGVSRGARDWGAMAGLFDKLLQLIPPGRERPPVYASGGGEVELPLRLTPPTATVSLSPSAPRAGEPFSVDVRIHWAGNFDEYLLHPPQLALPDGVEETGVSAETGGESGRSVVTYRIALEAATAGSYALDPVELRYTPRFESSPVSSRIAGPTVEVRPSATRRLVRGLAIGGGGLLGVSLVVGLVWCFRRGHGAVAAAGSEAAAEAAWRESLEAAQRSRLQGDLGESCLILLQLQRELLGDGEEVANERRELDASIERVRFGGEVPTPEELDRLRRRVERQVRERAPDPLQEEREAVQLRGTPADV